MTRFLLNRPIAVSMFYLSVVILGAISYMNMSVEGQPDTERPRIVVSARWGSTSPEVVQIFLTSPIEEAAAQVEGLEEMNSSSARGQSQVVLEFNRDTDMEFARLDLNERLSALRSDLPPGATQPTLSMSENNQESTDRFMSFDISGPYDRQRLTEIFTDNLRDEITSVDGVAALQVFGEQKRSLRVRLDREAMDLYGLVPAMVTGRVSELTRIYETPKTHMENQEYTILIANSIENIKTLEDLPIATYRDQPVRVKDVGDVEVGFAKLTSLSRLNGNPTLRVDLEREVGASVISTAERVKETVARVMPNMPQGFRLDWTDDEGEMMQEQLSSIYERGAWCLVLIVILLLVFLQSASAAVVITLNILFSVLITVNFMYYFGVTFNVVTLSGLAIGFGMLVDNAIVVLENIFRFREMGHSRFESAILGVKDIIWAVFAATLTTVSAFLCMYFLEDRLSVTYMPLALAVIFSLSASLMVSFTFTPLLSVLIRGSNITTTVDKRNAFARFMGHQLEKVNKIYSAMVIWSLRHKMLIVLVTAMFFFMFYRIFDNEIDKGGFSFFGSSDDRVFVYVRMPEGAELETADNVIKQFETPLLELESRGYKDVSTRVFSNVAIMEVSFESSQLASPYPLALKTKLVNIAQGFAGVGISVMGINSDDNYYSGNTGFETYNSSVRVMGYNYKELMDYANDILRGVKRNRRVKTTKLETSRRFRVRDQTETTMLVDREAVSRYDIDISYLMSFISRNLQLESTTMTKYQGEEMFLEVKFEDADDFDITDLESLVVGTEGGDRIRLADLVTIEERTVSGGIDRKDQQYAVNVRWDYKGSPKRARRYNEKIFNSLDPPAGYKVEMDYNEFMREDEEKNLYFVIGLAAIVVFMIMAALYESFVDPLVIFLTMPLAFIGVSWIYWYTGNSFDSTAYVGLIILAGIVVNNSILLVSHINYEVRRMDETGLDYVHAVAKACRDRLRPILLTAITTIVGLLPLLDEFVTWLMYNPVSTFIVDLVGISLPEMNLENRGLQQTLGMFSSLSRSTVGGMLSATFSTLLVIPVIYTIFFRTKQWIHTRIEEIFNLAKNKPQAIPAPDSNV
ncbi:MAG: efflux RND transporter permease subunit [Acidobacteriota bacterium]|nr:efflux RND transporter permease subunit [Acidobacteriota bacterium]